MAAMVVVREEAWSTIEPRAVKGRWVQLGNQMLTNSSLPLMRSDVFDELYHRVKGRLFLRQNSRKCI